MSLFKKVLTYVASFYALVLLMSYGAGAWGESASDIPVAEFVFSSAIAIGVISFWVTMIVHCLTERRVEKSRVGWMIALVLLNWLGAFAYFLFVYMNKDYGTNQT